jgi:hypothetical protein
MAINFEYTQLVVYRTRITNTHIGFTRTQTRSETTRYISKDNTFQFHTTSATYAGLAFVRMYWSRKEPKRQRASHLPNSHFPPHNPHLILQLTLSASQLPSQLTTLYWGCSVHPIPNALHPICPIFQIKTNNCTSITWTQNSLWSLHVKENRFQIKSWMEHFAKTQWSSYQS